MKDKNKKSGCTVVAIVVMVLALLLPLIYLLSVGPAVRLNATGHLSRESLFWFYSPVTAAETKSKWFACVVENYIELWKPAKPPMPLPKT